MAALLMLTLCLYACDRGQLSGENANNTATPAIAQTISLAGEETAAPDLANPIEPLFRD
jgi:hypothetical protein